MDYLTKHTHYKPILTEAQLTPHLMWGILAICIILLLMMDWEERKDLKGGDDK